MGGSGGSECFTLFMAIVVWIRRRLPCYRLINLLRAQTTVFGVCQYVGALNVPCWYSQGQNVIVKPGIAMSDRNLRNPGHVVWCMPVCCSRTSYEIKTPAGQISYDSTCTWKVREFKTLRSPDTLSPVKSRRLFCLNKQLLAVTCIHPFSESRLSLSLTGRFVTLQFLRNWYWVWFI
jgi:hypothetical protein